MAGIVFIVGTELSGNSQTWEGKGCAGGYVNCFTVAQDIPKALDNCREALTVDGYEIVIFDYAAVFNEADFEDSVETVEAVSRLKAESHNVQYGDFNVYGH